jgi:hypothetical protein
VEFLFVTWAGGAGALKAKREDVLSEMGGYAYPCPG